MGAEVAHEVLRSRTRSLFSLTLRLVSDRELLERIIEVAAEGAYEHLDAALDLLDAIGPDCTPTIIALTDRALRVYFGAQDWSLDGLKALVLVETAEVARWFV